VRIFSIRAIRVLTRVNAGKTRARTRKADFSQEIASKRIRPGQSNPVAEALGGNSRDDSMEL
jgi:hypothetical protein